MGPTGELDGPRGEGVRFGGVWKGEGGGREGLGGNRGVAGGAGERKGGVRKVWGRREGKEVAASANDFSGEP